MECEHIWEEYAYDDLGQWFKCQKCGNKICEDQADKYPTCHVCGEYFDECTCEE